MPEERKAQPVRTTVLIGKEAEHNTRLIHKIFQSGGFKTALKEEAAGTFPQRLQQAVKRRLSQSAIGCPGLVGRRKLSEPGVELEIAEMTNCGDDAARGLTSWW